jgi:cell division protein FtsX
MILAPEDYEMLARDEQMIYPDPCSEEYAEQCMALLREERLEEDRRRFAEFRQMGSAIGAMMVVMVLTLIAACVALIANAVQP